MVELPIVNQQKCRKAYKQVYNGVVCAGGQKDKGICSGDSGGPFQCYLNKKWVYIGLDSYTALCALPEYPSVFTYVPYFTSWAKDKIAKNS
jgi:secreted trypsin-like serine protease